MQRGRAAGSGGLVDRDPRQDGERPGRIRRGLGGKVPAVEERDREPDLRLRSGHAASGDDYRGESIGTERVARGRIRRRWLLRAERDRAGEEREEPDWSTTTSEEHEAVSAKQTLRISAADPNV